MKQLVTANSKLDSFFVTADALSPPSIIIISGGFIIITFDDDNGVLGRYFHVAILLNYIYKALHSVQSWVLKIPMTIGVKHTINTKLLEAPRNLFIIIKSEHLIE